MGIEDKYPDLVFLAQIAESIATFQEWPKLTELPIKMSGDLVYVYGFSPYIEPLFRWIKEDSKRDIVFLEDDIAVFQQILAEEHSEILLDPQVHLRLRMEGASIADFASDVVRDFPCEKLEFICMKPESALFQELKLELMRKSVVEVAVHNEMMHYHQLFYNLLANFKRLPQAFDVGKWKGALHNRPAIICGAGPSLAGAMESIRSVDNRAVIFAGGSAIVALNAKRIFPHLLFAIDPNVEEFTRLALHTAFQTPLIYGNRVRPEIFDGFVGPSGYLVTGTGGELESWMEEKLGIIDPKALEHLGKEALSVTCVAVMSAIFFGCNPIIFAGVDLSYGDGKRYPDGVLSDLHCSLEQKDTRVSETLHVHQGKITATKWIMERDVISDVIARHKEITFVDATGQGLPFDHVEKGDGWTARCKEIFDVRSLIHEKVLKSPLEVTEKQVEETLEEFQSSLQACDQLLTDILSEGSPSKVALYEMELEEQLAYKLVLAQAAYACTFPLARETRGEADSTVIRSRLYRILQSLVKDYLYQLE